MAHENDVARALGRAYTATLAIGVVEFEAVTYAFQHALRAIGAASVALVTDAAGQAAGCFGGIFETEVHFVESRASLGQAE